jgi:hypothetical protein
MVWKLGINFTSNCETCPVVEIGIRRFVRFNFSTFSADEVSFVSEILTATGIVFNYFRQFEIPVG